MTNESHRQASGTPPASAAASPGDPRPAARSLRRVPVQDRGRRRVEAILDAAALVIAEVGVEAASTNAIAARAGAAKGSLYQFFPSKDAIVAALATRYASDLQALHARTFPDAPRGVPLPRLVDGIVDPLAEYHDRNPAFRHVFNISPSRRGPATDTAVRKEWEALNRSIVARVVALLGALAPTMSEADRTRHALVMTTAGEALLALRDDTPKGRRAAVLADLKRLLLGYLTPLLAN